MLFVGKAILLSMIILLLIFFLYNKMNHKGTKDTEEIKQRILGSMQKPGFLTKKLSVLPTSIGETWFLTQVLGG
jgi:hypothetical protein